MSKYTSANEISKHLDKTTFFNDFVKYADKNGVKINRTDINISRTLISTQVKAYIARNMIDNEGFYPIIKEIDNTLLKAEEILSKN
jgi:carboxyl-terminal processing protease